MRTDTVALADSADCPLSSIGRQTCPDSEATRNLVTLRERYV